MDKNNKEKESKGSKDAMKTSSRREEPSESFGHETPGAAEGDLETIEQDLEQREQGGPEQ